MKKDRAEICKIMSDMLDNPGECGIYPTSTAYTRLEHYIEQERILALGWSHAHFCLLLDAGLEPRTEDVPHYLSMAIEDLKE